MIADTALASMVRETYAAHYVFWNLGIEPDAIKVLIVPTLLPHEVVPAVRVSVRVECQGTSFALPIGPELGLVEDQRAFLQAWTKHIDSLPQRRRTDRAGLDLEARRTETWSRKTEIIYAMLAKGFELGLVKN